MRIALACVLLAGCGGSSKPADTTPQEQDCEPGRCLSDVAAVVAKHKPTARACYEKGLARAPEIKGGRIWINFEIDPEGMPREIAQSVKDDQIQDAEVVGCVSDVIKGLTFAKSGKGKTIRAYHVFEFSPRPK